MNKRKRVVVIALIIFSSFLTSLFFQNCAPIKSQADLPSTDSGTNTPSSTPNPGAGPLGCVGSPPAPVVRTISACPSGQQGTGTIGTVTYACVGTTYQPQAEVRSTSCTPIGTTPPPNLTPAEKGMICDDYIDGTTPVLTNTVTSTSMDSGLGNGGNGTGNGDGSSSSITANMTANIKSGSQNILPPFPGITGARADTSLTCTYTTEVLCEVVPAQSSVTQAINKDINSNFYGLNEIDEINKITDATDKANKYRDLVNRIFSTAKDGGGRTCSFDIDNPISGTRSFPYTLNHVRDDMGHLCVEARLHVRMSATTKTSNGVKTSNRSAYSEYDVVVSNKCWDEDRLKPLGGTLPTTANYGAVVAASSNWVVVLSQSDNDAGQSQIGSISVFDRNNFALAPTKFSLSGLVGGGSTGDGTFSASLAGDWLAVGAFNRSTYKGQVQFFVREGSSWNKKGVTLTSGLATDKASFGYAVALSSNGILAVGAPRYTNTPSTGTGDLSGHVYLFTCNANGCDQNSKGDIVSTAVGSYFGASLSISGNRLAVGAPYVTAQSDSHGDGYVKVYDISGVTATQVGKVILPPGDSAVSTGPSDIKISNPVAVGGVKAGRAFGSSVAVLGNKLIVGAPNKSRLESNGTLTAKVGEAYYYANFTSYDAVSNPNVVNVLNNSGAQQDSRYGQGVALNNNGAFTGCPYCQTNKGQVYYFLYRGDGTVSTTETRTTFPTDRTNRDGFGNAIFANDTDVIVGASNRTVGSSTQAGAAYRFSAPLAGREY